jgi:hypothetical protein
LTAAEADVDEATRRRAAERVRRWTEVVSGMQDGRLRIGSRTPVGGMPAWATLEVATGGFATGQPLAGGPLLGHEQRLAVRLRIPADDTARLTLNRYYLTERGMAELSDRLERGTYKIGTAEEGALLVVVWLLGQARVDEAWALLDVITPYFAHLRFYPIPTEQRQFLGSRVFVRDVRSVVESLKAISPNKSVEAQRETLEIWTPFYDELVELLLETVEGAPPMLVFSNEGEAAETPCRVEGGVPGRNFPDDWLTRANDLLVRYRQLRAAHRLSSKPTRRKSNLAQLIPYLDHLAENRSSFAEHESDRLRTLLARYVSKYGLPGSERHQADRGRRRDQAATKLHSEVAAVVIDRLRSYPIDRGVDDLEPILKPIAEDEHSAGARASGELPSAIRRKVERCLCETVDVLVRRGLISSGDVLADVLPQVTSGLRAADIVDARLRSLYASIYRAFRRRRSLLLLNLEGQVRIEELPWVAAIEGNRREGVSAIEASRQAFGEIVQIALTSFPHAILPNRLVRELRALANGAGLRLPLVDELAADIFMGTFTATFSEAARSAARLLEGSLYEKYYRIDFREIHRLLVGTGATTALRRLFGGFVAKDFAQICFRRAGVERKGYTPAVNGMVIEQQQILTTQNLAVLYSAIDSDHALRGRFPESARQVFDWVIRRLQVRQADHHAKLVSIKTSAYAWRQMVFFLSLTKSEELSDFFTWARDRLAVQAATFRERFRPALDGLEAAAKEIASEPLIGVPGPFLGWTQGTHWLLE